MAKARVAVVQAGSFVFDTSRTLVSVRSYCDQAATCKAGLAVFPEAFLGGYPKGMDFGARVGSRSAEGREDFRRYWESAIEIPGPEVQALSGIAKGNHLEIVIGVV